MIRACPKGLGSPVFDKLEAELAKAFMSLPASKAGARTPESVRACKLGFPPHGNPSPGCFMYQGNSPVHNP